MTCFFHLMVYFVLLNISFKKSVKDVVRKQVEDKDQREGNAGLMEAWSHAQYAGETERERERENTQKTIFQKTLAQYSSMYMCVCSMHTFIQVLGRTDRSTIVLQCSLRAPTLTPKYIPYGISFFASLGFLSRTGISDRSQPTRYSA